MAAKSYHEIRIRLRQATVKANLRTVAEDQEVLH